MASSGHVAFYPAFAQIEGRGDLTRSYLQLIERTWNQEGTAYVAQREEIIAQTVFVSLPSLSKSALFRSRIEMEI